MLRKNESNLRLRLWNVTSKWRYKSGGCFFLRLVNVIEDTPACWGVFVCFNRLCVIDAVVQVSCERWKKHNYSITKSYYIFWVNFYWFILICSDLVGLTDSRIFSHLCWNLALLSLNSYQSLEILRKLRSDEVIQWLHNMLRWSKQTQTKGLEWQQDRRIQHWKHEYNF